MITVDKYKLTLVYVYTDNVNGEEYVLHLTSCPTDSSQQHQHHQGSVQGRQSGPVKYYNRTILNIEKDKYFSVEILPEILIFKGLNPKYLLSPRQLTQDELPHALTRSIYLFFISVQSRPVRDFIWHRIKVSFPLSISKCDLTIFYISPGGPHTPTYHRESTGVVRSV